jgi:hypothetical protein
MAQIATIFFSWFAPKEMKKLLKEMREFFSDLDPNLIGSLKK